MSNVIIFQPYLSNRALSSNTVERQFRFLKSVDTNVFAILGIDEAEYAKYLATTGWITPLVVDFKQDIKGLAKQLVKDCNPFSMFISRTYCTPSTTEDELQLKYNLYDESDMRFRRNRLPVDLADLGVHVHHVIYDPLELKYDDIIPAKYYSKCSSMNNVEGAATHLFADKGYYDTGKEVALKDKKYLFTFGATSVEPKRSAQIVDLYNRLNEVDKCNVYVRVQNLDNLIPNDKYELNTSKSLFTYTLPSYSPIHMSFTRMLLALSQNTMPLLHPDNNIDCLFGEGFEVREDLRQFFKKLIMSHDELENLLKSKSSKCIAFYSELLKEWQSTNYYKWLQEVN